MNGSGSSHVVLLTATFLAVMGLYAYQKDAIPADDFALGRENHHGSEEWSGVTFTASSVERVATVIAQHAADESHQHRKYVAWLGNSQLHTINQYKTGDHLAPYWLRTHLQAPDLVVPFGISLPNASLQEHLVLSRYIQGHLNMSAMILELVFDDLREDDLRGEFSAILTDELRKDILRSPAGQRILRLSHPESGDSRKGTPGEANAELLRDRIEAVLTGLLGQVWVLWDHRPGLRAELLEDLYYLRNWAFGIKPTSVEK